MLRSYVINIALIVINWFYLHFVGVVVVLSCHTSFVAVGTGVIRTSKMVQRANETTDHEESRIRFVKLWRSCY